MFSEKATSPLAISRNSAAAANGTVADSGGADVAASTSALGGLCFGRLATNGVDGGQVDSGRAPAQHKRSDYISWEEMFMGMALLAAQRSKDPYMQVGAVIANEDNVIVGVGYNGMPVGCSDDEFPWGKGAADPLDNKHPYVCHAEMNAILNKNCSSIRGSTIYTTYFPCNECTKLIIQSKIAHVIYMVEKPMKPETIAAKRMLDNVGVQHRQFTTSRAGLTVEFQAASR